MFRCIGFGGLVSVAVVAGAVLIGSANAVQAQTVVHVRTADLKVSDTANMKIEAVHWHGGSYSHSYYRAPYRAYYGGPYRAYYGGGYYGGGAYRAWYGNPYYSYWRYPYSYGPRYYAPAYYGSAYYGPTYYGYPNSSYYAPQPSVYPAAPVVVAPYGGFYW